jgi:hypothetical protein
MLPFVGMLVLAVPTGCIAGALSIAWYSGQPFYELALGIAVALMFGTSIAVVVVTFAAYLAGRLIASRSGAGESAAVIVGYASAVVVGGAAVAVTGLTFEVYSAQNYLWPTVAALVAALLGGALGLLLRNEPRPVALPLD